MHFDARNGQTSGVTSVDARPPASLKESMRAQFGWLCISNREAAPRPVGPAPITRTSTDSGGTEDIADVILQLCNNTNT